MADRFRVREFDASGRPVTGVGPDHAAPGTVLDGPQAEWLVEQGYLEPEAAAVVASVVSSFTAPAAVDDATDVQEQD